MKIIERGTLPSEATYRATCRNCHSKIEFEQSEGKLTYDQRDGNYLSVACPVCNHLVTVAVKQDRSIG